MRLRTSSQRGLRLSTSNRHINFGTTRTTSETSATLTSVAAQRHHGLRGVRGFCFQIARPGQSKARCGLLLLFLRSGELVCIFRCGDVMTIFLRSAEEQKTTRAHNHHWSVKNVRLHECCWEKLTTLFAVDLVAFRQQLFAKSMYRSGGLQGSRQSLPMSMRKISGNIWNPQME